MSRTLRSVGSVLVIGLTVAACSAGVQPTMSPTATPQPVATTAPPPAATPKPTATPAPTLPPIRSGNSKAGTYRIEHVEPEIHVTLPAGWELYFNDAGGAYMNTGGGELLLARPEQVIVPDTNDHEPAPEDLLAWFVDHSSLRVTEPTPVEIAPSEMKTTLNPRIKPMEFSITLPSRRDSWVFSSSTPAPEISET